jgi:hypothetical protein
MNSNMFFALILIVVAIALGDRISDTILAIAIGVGTVSGVIGILQVFRQSRNKPTDAE